MNCKGCNFITTWVYCEDCTDRYVQIQMQRGCSKQAVQMTLSTVESDEKMSQRESEDYFVQVCQSIDHIYDSFLEVNKLEDYRLELKYGKGKD